MPASHKPEEAEGPGNLGFSVEDLSYKSIGTVIEVDFSGLRRAGNTSVLAQVSQALEDLGANVVAWIQARAPRGAQEGRHAADSLESEVRGQAGGVVTLEVISTLPHAFYALEHGRPPGKLPPYEVIKESLLARQFQTNVRLAQARSLQSVRQFRGPVTHRIAGTSARVNAPAKQQISPDVLLSKQIWKARDTIATRGVKAPELITKAIAAHKGAIEDLKAMVAAAVATSLDGKPRPTVRKAPKLIKKGT